MKDYFILFAIGKDRPGIVRDVSGFLLDRGANIEDSRMAAMGGRFTVTVLFSCDSKQRTDLENDSAALEDLGLFYSIHEADNPESLDREAALPLRIDVSAMDHAGIVASIVRVLHKHSVNIESLETQVENAPFSGESLFNLKLFASVPAIQPLAKIKGDLNDLAEEQNLDLAFRRRGEK